MVQCRIDGAPLESVLIEIQQSSSANAAQRQLAEGQGYRGPDPAP